MNFLVDGAPTQVEVDGELVEIRSDFRASILFEELMQDEEVPEHQKILQALELYYPVVPQNLTQAVERMLWFYRCGKEPEQVGEASSSAPVYSFEQDAGYIYAAFLGQYGVDLEAVEYLHWWKFRAMFQSLASDCEFVKIMGYRGMTISPKMSNEQKQFYRDMKKLYALPISQKKKKQISALEEALMGSGDVSGLLQGKP